MEKDIKAKIIELAKSYLPDVNVKCWLDIKEFDFGSKLYTKRCTDESAIFNLSFFEFGEVPDFEQFEKYFFDNYTQTVNNTKCDVEILQVREFDKNGTFTRMYKIQFNYTLG